MKKKFTFFIIILALLLGVAGYWYSQKNIYSREVLKLEILGPSEANLAEEVEYLVKYKNNGDVRLDEPRLLFEFPSYSVLESGESLRKIINSEELGEAIYPGEEKTLKFKARLLGKEGEAKEAKVTLGYRVKNLSAWYESDTTFTTIIKKVPLNFSFDLPSKLEPSKELKFRLNYFSNVDFPLSDLRIKIDYPSGFEFKDSNPKALEEKEWEIGLLNKTEGGRIEISGFIKGELNEEKIFRAELGTWQEGEFILLKETFKGAEIAEPDLYIIQQINGNPGYTAKIGDTLHYEVFFKNLGQESLSNLHMLVQLEGELFNLETIKAPTGDFEKGDSSILFDWRKNPDLMFLSNQKEGKVDFWVEIKEDWTISDIGRDKNPVLKNRVILAQAREEFETKVNSKLEIIQRGYFQDEVFGNSGPIPPKIGETTTYTIIWQVKNHYNRIGNTKVKAILPQGVELTGKIFPEGQSQKFTFDSQSREIVWDTGDLEPGTGVLSPAPNISFQIALTPIQKGKALLIKEAKISGEDQWTEQILEVTAPKIDTTLPNDDTVSEEEGIVR
jgi:hypothetical protein